MHTEALDEGSVVVAMKKPKKAKKAKKVPTAALAKPITVSEQIESVLIGGNLNSLTVEQRVEYYRALCRSLGLNPLTKPFDYLALNGKLVLYAKRDCTDQLRKIHHVSVTHLTSQTVDGMCIVRVEVKDREGRTDAAIGAVWVKALSGLDLANAIMKTETKAKRRATLSICGLGMLDESELDTVENAHFLTPGGRVMYEVEEQGSQEAADAVAARKIAEYKARQEQQVAPQPAEPAGPENPAPAQKEADSSTNPFTKAEPAKTAANAPGGHASGSPIPSKTAQGRTQAPPDMRAKLPPPIDLDALPPLPQTGGGAQAADKTRGGSSVAGSSESPALSAPGPINSAKESITKIKGIPVLIVNWKGIFLSCFHQKTLWEYLAAGVGKEAELVLSSDKRNIEGIRRIGNREFEPDGKTPIIQMGEDRPKTTADLFA